MNPLSLTTFPLDQVSLIEASAGTGKTYALANLYLRYVLEKGFTADRILVVTFTEAATQELRDRIRGRIRELITVFSGHPTTDPLLAHLKDQSENPDSDCLRLKLAERQMDQAEIHTIHGFCQRLLKEYVLESGAPIESQLEEDMLPHRREAVQDFWRVELLSLPEEAIAYVASVYPDPDALLGAISPLLNREPEYLVPSPLVDGLQGWLELFSSALEWFTILKRETLKHYDEVYSLLAASPIKRVKDKLKWLDMLHKWSASGGPDFRLPGTSSRPNLFAAFTPDRLADEMKAGQEGRIPQHSFFDFIENHLEQMPENLLQQFLIEAWVLVQSKLEQRKSEQGMMGFDDLISRVAKALGHGAPSDENTREVANLVALIRRQFDVALIDEFQDTDAKQYAVFRRLFGSACQEAVPRLVLIGDPKQAIYAFRGGDIATYLKAKREISQSAKTLGRACVFTMDRNWRSSPDIVRAVNHLFSRRGNAFMAEEIPFFAVEAARQPKVGMHDAALVVHQLRCDDKKREAHSDGLAWIATMAIHTLLIGKARNMYQPDSSEIAVLVRTGAEAELMKSCLANAGIRASFEGRERVYDTPEAFAIYFLMLAMLNPGDLQAIKRCLIEPVFAFDDEALGKLDSDSDVWARMHSSFVSLNQVWGQHGILAALRAALAELEVLAHWRELPDSVSGRQWERSLTNYNQLAELLQVHSASVSSRPALVRWFEACIQGEEGASDDTRLRLESDDRLVRIVTIHKSKGLEYPIVFVPFLFAARETDQAWFYDDQGRLSLDLTGADETFLAATRERLAEDMRLLYVALTRAKYQCHIGTSAFVGRSRGALGLLGTAWSRLVFSDLGEPELSSLKLDHDMLGDALKGLAAEHSDCIRLAQHDIDSIDAGWTELFDNTDTAPPHEENDRLVSEHQCRVLERALDSEWKVQSFTGLLNEAGRIDSWKRDALSDLLSVPLLSEARHVESGRTRILDFPRGSRPGTFLHLLFESVEFETGELLPELRASHDNLQAFIEAHLTRFQLVPSVKIPEWAEFLAAWVRQVLCVPLMGQVALNEVSSQDSIAEMRFYFPVEHLSSIALNRVLQSFDPDSAWLDFSAFSGFMQGAIDLVFRSGGQYFVLDYKSNHLGDQAEDYLPAALYEEIKAHRYDVQFLLYVVAVHRLLRHRMGERYDYERDFGGVLYVFLRGLDLSPEIPSEKSADPVAQDGASDVPGVYFVKPALTVIESLDSALAGEGV